MAEKKPTTPPPRPRPQETKLTRFIRVLNLKTGPFWARLV